MSLIVKSISNILTEVRDTLQDQQKTRWTDQELYRYVDQGVRDIALTTRHLRTKAEIHVGDPNLPQTTTDYNLPLEAIDFKEIVCAQAYEILDANTLRFPDNVEELVTVEYYAFPARVYFGSTTGLSMDEDLYDALKFFIVSRAYQKEASTENIQKASYFKGEYDRQLDLNLARWYSTFNVSTSRTDFFT